MRHIVETETLLKLQHLSKYTCVNSEVQWSVSLPQVRVLNSVHLPSEQRQNRPQSCGPRDLSSVRRVSQTQTPLQNIDRPSGWSSLSRPKSTLTGWSFGLPPLHRHGGSTGHKMAALSHHRLSNTRYRNKCNMRYLLGLIIIIIIIKQIIYCRSVLSSSFKYRSQDLARTYLCVLSRTKLISWFVRLKI